MSRKTVIEACGGLFAAVTIALIARKLIADSYDQNNCGYDDKTLKFTDEIVVKPYVPPKNWFESLYLNWELRDDVLNDGLASYSPPGWGLRIMKEIVIYYTPGLVFLFCAANDPDVVGELEDEFSDIREEIIEIVEEINNRYNRKTSVALIPPPPINQSIVESSTKGTEYVIADYISRAKSYSGLCEELADQLNVPFLGNFWKILDECTYSRNRQYDHFVGSFHLDTKTRIDLFKSLNAKYLQPELKM